MSQICFGDLRTSNCSTDKVNNVDYQQKKRTQKDTCADIPHPQLHTHTGLLGMFLVIFLSCVFLLCTAGSPQMKHSFDISNASPPDNTLVFLIFQTCKQHSSITPRRHSFDISKIHVRNRFSPYDTLVDIFKCISTSELGITGHLLGMFSCHSIHVYKQHASPQQHHLKRHSFDISNASATAGSPLEDTHLIFPKYMSTTGSVWYFQMHQPQQEPPCEQSL